MKTNRQNVHDIKRSMSVITPDMQIIDIIGQCRETETIFKQLEQKTGACICCQALFLPLGKAAERYGFDLKHVMTDIQAVIEKQEASAER